MEVNRFKTRLFRVLRGDTLVEVMFAVGIFGMVSVGAVTVMNRGLYTTQSTLETTMARNEVDAQAEALRFIHDAYISEGGVAQKTYTNLWDKILENSYTTSSLLSEQPDFFDSYTGGETSCEELYQNLPSKSFVVNPRYLNSADIDELLKTNTADKLVIRRQTSATGDAPAKLSTTATYPRIIYVTSTDETLSDSTSDIGTSPEFLSAEGIYVVAVASDAGTKNGSTFSPEFYDFYIRTCWDNVGGSGANTISTVIRLANSDLIEIEEDVETPPTPSEPTPIQGWNCALLPGVGSITTLTDERDGKTYTVARLADGNCWTTQNYSLDTGTYATDNGDHYYDQSTAKSLCPSGWHLPTHEEYVTLDNALNNNIATYLSAPNNFVYSGKHNGSEAVERYNSGSGYYWSQSSAGGGLAYGLYFHNRDVNPNHTASSDDLYAVRCINYDEYYYIKFNANGGSGSMPDQTAILRRPFALPSPNFSRPLYNLVSWNTRSDGSGTRYELDATLNDPVGRDETLILYAQWEKKTYTIAFRPGEGGSGSMPNQRANVVENVTINANAFTRSEFHFNQWNGSDRVNYPDRGTVNKPESFANQTLTLTATWLCDTYFVIYRKNDGSGTNSPFQPCRGASFTIKTINELSGFSRSGYQFMGWAASASSNTPIYTGGETVSNLATKDNTKNLYAIWKLLRSHTLTYDANGGNTSSVPASQSSGSTTATSYTFTVSSTTPTRDNYTFTGWKDGAGTSYSGGSSITVSGSATLYAQWGADQWTVAFDCGGGSGYKAPEAVNVGSSYTVPGNHCSRGGYSFTGWRGSNGVNYSVGSSIPSQSKGTTITLTAQWNLSSVVVTFFKNVPGSTETTAQSVSKNTPTNLQANNFVYADHCFAGWNTSSTGNGTSYGDRQSVTLNNDLTLYAQWVLKNRWVLDGPTTPLAQQKWNFYRDCKKIEGSSAGWLYSTNSGHDNAYGYYMPDNALENQLYKDWRNYWPQISQSAHYRDYADNFYYIGSNGVMISGWHYLNNSYGVWSWYYLLDTNNEDINIRTGRMVHDRSNFTTSDIYGYVNLDHSGKCTNCNNIWIHSGYDENLNRYWYHTDGSGVPQKGWQCLSWDGANKWYYFDDNGRMLHDTYSPDGYWLGSDGAWGSC